MRNLVVAVAVAAAIAGTVATTASASAPVHDRYTLTDGGVASRLCAFPIVVSSTANIDDALFFDETGRLVRILETVNHVEITYSANGKTLSATGTGGINIVFNADGTESAQTFGINLLLTIPGEGAVWLDAGRAEYLFSPRLHLLFQAGPAQYDMAAFCAALAP